ncbi:MAG: hypothetical protein ACO3QU_05365 [Ilumatobacteraceae bacterium]
MTLREQITGAALADLQRLLPGSSLTNYPPVEQWSDWVELDSKEWAHGRKTKRRFTLIPTS